MVRLLFSALIIVFAVLGCSREESVREYRPPEFKGRAYVLPEGADHIAVVSLKDGSLNSIKISSPANQVIKTDEGTLYILGKDGILSVFDINNHRMVKTYRVGVNLCGGALDDRGRVWVTDVGTQRLLLFDPSQQKVLDGVEIPEGLCGVIFDRNRGSLYLIDRRQSALLVFDLKSKKVVDRIPSIGNSVHLGALSPAGDSLWIAEGNEYRDGRPYGVGFARTEAMPGGINIVDLKLKQMVDFILVGGNTVDIGFSPDGGLAYAVSSQMAEYDDASLAVIDVRTRRVIKTYSLCKPCHVKTSPGVKLERAFVRSVALELE